MSKKRTVLSSTSGPGCATIETMTNDSGGLRAASRSTTSDMDALFYPARAFDHPDDVVDNPDLTLNEKRAILASWASDACAVEAAPALRRPPGSKQVVRVDDILEALRALDKQAGEPSVSWATRRVRRASIEAFREQRALSRAVRNNRFTERRN